MIELRLEFTPPNARWGVWLIVGEREHRVSGMDTKFDGTIAEIEKYWRDAAKSLGLKFKIDEVTAAAIEDAKNGDEKWSKYFEWCKKNLYRGT
jgi:predicted YcjX-like family ATPase